MAHLEKAVRQYLDDLEKRSGVSALSIDGRSLAARATNVYRRLTVWIRRRSQFW